MPRQVQQLYKHGNATVLTISRNMLFHLNWIPGQAVIVELLEDKSGLVVRLPIQEDFGVLMAPKLGRSRLLSDGQHLPLDPPGSAR